MRPTTPLLTDLYQLTMLQAYFDREMYDDAVFEFFVRRLPPQRNFLLAAGLEQALEYLETLRFSSEDLAALEDTGLFSSRFLRWLANFRFTGTVEAMPEGTVFFANEPTLRVIAPLPQAQLAESRLVNILHYQTLIASRAARCVLAADGRLLVDFGMRRAHGSEAAVFAARASYLAGFAGTSNVLAKPLFDIPIFGTMAHSFIEAHDTELAAFEHFMQSHRGNIVLLIDTYDTETGARRVAEAAQRLTEKPIHSVRLDSGDLQALAGKVRHILDDAGLPQIGIFASGGLDELEVERLVGSAAPIDGFGIGTSLDISADCPALDCVYKLEEYAGVARRKRSTGKATWPGRKQVFRQTDSTGCLRRDELTLVSDTASGEPLLQTVMRDGIRLGPAKSLLEVREHARVELTRLPQSLRSLAPAAVYEVRVSDSLRCLARKVDAQFH
jgi:nicotinate phosphoribosyltransferase